MFQAFVIVLREGFEAFLIVSIIVSYLRRVGREWLMPAVRWGIGVSILASAALGFVLSRGVNEPLWEGVLGLVAAVFVTTLVVQMWRHGRTMKQEMEKKLGGITLRWSGMMEAVGVFFFTAFMITREGMETALMLIQVPEGRILAGAVLGALAMLALCALWVRFSALINLKLFFQVTGIFLLLFVAQILIYSFHELTEAGVFPKSEYFHAATEPLSPEGFYGRWFAVITVAVCGGWLVVAWAIDRFRRRRAS